MDVRDWPINQIMQLPDHCFGRRFSQIFRLTELTDTTKFYIHHLALPDVCVLWELWAWNFAHYDQLTETWLDTIRFRLALGDVLPITGPQFAALEEIPLGAYGVDEYLGSCLHLTRLRLPVIAQGRRVVVAGTAILPSDALFNLALVFSSIPNEVPDCLLSG